jgi:hypothetical protein
MTAEIASETPLIDLVVPNGGGRITIRKAKDIRTGIDQEEEKWSKLYEKAIRELPNDGHHKKTTEQLAALIIRNHFQSMRPIGSATSQDKSPSQVDEFIRLLTTLDLQPVSNPLANSVRFHHVESLSEESPLMTIGALALMWAVDDQTKMRLSCLSGGLSLLLADAHGREPQGWRNALVTVVEEARHTGTLPTAPPGTTSPHIPAPACHSAHCCRVPRTPPHAPTQFRPAKL